MLAKNEYVQAAMDRIIQWCEAAKCPVPTIAQTAIIRELKTMFECREGITKIDSNKWYRKPFSKNQFHRASFIVHGKVFTKCGKSMNHPHINWSKNPDHSKRCLICERSKL